MAQKTRFALYISILLLGYCFNGCRKQTEKSTIDAVKSDSIELSIKNQFQLYDDLSSRMSNKVVLDSLLKKITHQEKVEIVATLISNWDNALYKNNYTDGNYTFSTQFYSLEDEPKDEWRKALFSDGNIHIRFSDCGILCDEDSIFHCENYGFDNRNFLSNVRIIKVCNKLFLYADVDYWCNGIGCGCFMNFIYDIKNKSGTFIENYRIPFDGFYLSDFNNDNIPDLLVISSSQETAMKGFKLDEFQLKLTSFSLEDGAFKPTFDQRYQRHFTYELYSFTPVYHHSYHSGLIYSITKDEWFRD